MIEITVIESPEKEIGFGVSVKAPGEKLSNFTCLSYAFLPGNGWISLEGIDGMRDASACYRFDICRLFLQPKA